MTEYTPTTEEVIRGFSAPPYKLEPRRGDESFAVYLSRMSIESHEHQMLSEAAIRRWLAAHDREVAAAAVAEFVGRVGVAYRRHSGAALEEDIAIAISEFGVSAEQIYGDEDPESIAHGNALATAWEVRTDA
jgi:hypothetical protein